MTQVYQIKSGDTLTKIAKEQYGLNGNEAYQKALEIAKQNGIANPNLIHAGASLNLFGLGEEAQEPENAGTDAFTTQTQEADEPENAYKALMEAQKQYSKQLAGIAEKDAKEVKNFQIAELSKENKEEEYMDAILNLVEQDIETNDKEDENGIKDGAIDYKEFEAQQLAFYKATYGDLDTNDKELAQLLGLQDIFNMQDIDGSGVLEKNELAFSYMMSDANFDDKTFGKNTTINIEDNLEFDGIIDFDNQASTAMMLNKDMLEGGKTYSNIYNKVADMITAGIKNKTVAK